LPRIDIGARWRGTDENRGNKRSLQKRAKAGHKNLQMADRWRAKCEVHF
jgi:hypothetical protein